MDELHLQKLIEQICQSPEDSRERNRLMDRLILEFSKDQKLVKSSHPDYLEAVNDTWLWLCKIICKNIVNQELNRESLLKIINRYLYWRILDLYRRDKGVFFSLDVIVSTDGIITTLGEMLPAKDVNGIDDYLEKLQLQAMEKITLQLENYIEEDPESKLRNTYIRKVPDCNCQFLAKKLLLKDPPEKMSNIASKLNISQQTIYSFWKRKCLSILQEIAIELGYKAE